MPFPKREYFTIDEVAKRWGTDVEQVKYSIFHDGLEACCWFDGRRVSYYEMEGASSYKEYVKGYLGLYSEDCRRVFRPGDIYIRRFYILDSCSYICVDEQNRVLIHPEEIRVRLSACLEFEEKFDLIPPKERILTIHDKYTIYYNGDILALGHIQMEIINLLIDARKRNRNWVNGKNLLEHSGSEATRLRDLFKGNFAWKELIQSDKRGHYRLHEDIVIRYSQSKAA